MNGLCSDGDLSVLMLRVKSIIVFDAFGKRTSLAW